MFQQSEKQVQLAFFFLKENKTFTQPTHLISNPYTRSFYPLFRLQDKK